MEFSHYSFDRSCAFLTATWNVCWEKAPSSSRIYCVRHIKVPAQKWCHQWTSKNRTSGNLFSAKIPLPLSWSDITATSVNRRSDYRGQNRFQCAVHVDAWLGKTETFRHARKCVLRSNLSSDVWRFAAESSNWRKIEQLFISSGQPSIFIISILLITVNLRTLMSWLLQYL